MEKFIPEVGPTSEIEPKETRNPIVEAVGTLMDGVNQVLWSDEEDDEFDWIWFGVGGPA